MNDTVYTTNQAADYLKLSPKTLVNWRGEGKGPRFVRLGRAVRYRKSDLDAYVAGLKAYSSTAA